MESHMGCTLGLGITHPKSLRFLYSWRDSTLLAFRGPPPPIYHSRSRSSCHRGRCRAHLTFLLLPMAAKRSPSRALVDVVPEYMRHEYEQQLMTFREGCRARVTNRTLSATHPHPHGLPGIMGGGAINHSLQQLKRSGSCCTFQGGCVSL